ncbi:unnamed protein product [Nezara viridula]|uniref:Epidermal growth factor receptor substrate 15-like 1 n=1 Tax=Nezara viridula TaxID=85310 RepID=A0A9P0E7V6_NEZVI|nr:unnamed protein product [Nezara viridula]
MVAGSHYSVYENYFSKLEQQGTIPAVDAARFLKTSGLSDAILSKIWDLSDPNGKGFLNKVGFFVALKLVSLAQLGYDVSQMHLLLDVPAPKFDMAATNILPRRDSHPISDWAMTPIEKLKYEQLFESLQPINGVIPGNKVKGLLIDSKLPVATLGKIWDLADMDKDGSLDKHEFTVAMHLVYKALEKYAIPNSLPPELLPPGRQEGKQTGNQLITNGNSAWVVSPDDKLKFDNLFILADVDKDGYVSGNEIKDVFLRSGVPQPILASIWSLCDIKQSGKLNAEQFALAMWFIQQKVKSNVDPPLSLTPEMIPPSMRSQIVHDVSNSANNNPELDMIGQDIEDLSKEKHVLEAEILQKEAEIKIKSSEAKSLQVDKLRKDAEEQEALVKSQEQELMSKKQELESLKLEESRLSTQQLELNQKLNALSNSLQDSQLTISMVKTKILQIQEHQLQLKDAISSVDSALTAGDSVPQHQLELEPEYRDPYPFSSNTTFSAPFTKSTKGFDSDPFSSFDTHSNRQDPFDPFEGKKLHQSEKSNDESNQDPFGCEPFGAPAPALPPKNKQPPPRPAPPRPSVPPSHSQTSDSFADFSNFNSKGPQLEFTEDPFKDYRYEDIFNIEDPFLEAADKKSNTVFPDNDPFSPGASSQSNVNNANAKYKSTEILADSNDKKTNSEDELKDTKFSKSDSLPNLLS